MGNCNSVINFCTNAADNMATEGYINGDIETFNKAIQNGAKLLEFGNMDKNFLKLIANHHEVSYPNRILEIADKANDVNLTKQILKNFISQEVFNSTTLSVAIKLDDASSVSKILTAKPFLSNKDIHLNPLELPKTNNNQLNNWDKLALLNSYPIPKTAEPLALALYRAGNKSKYYLNTPSDFSANIKIIQSLIESGADHKNKIDANLFLFNSLERSSSYFSENKITPLEFASKYTSNDISQALKDAIQKENRKKLDGLMSKQPSRKSLSLKLTL